jgi:hypothetical protein
MQLWQSKNFWSPYVGGEQNISIVMLVWQSKTFQSPQCFPLPSPIFFPSLLSPLMAIETLLVAILCDPLIKKWDN